MAQTVQNHHVHVHLAAPWGLTLCDPVDCSPPGSSGRGILQARTLEWVAMPSSRGSCQPRDWTQVSRIEGGFFTIWATREALRTTIWPSNFTARYIAPPKNSQILIQKDTCIIMFIAALCTIAKIRKQSNCPSTDEWIKKIWYIYTMGHYSVMKRMTFCHL